MSDAMLSELYERVFKTKKEAEVMGQDETSDRKREVALAKNRLLSELIDIRTKQIVCGKGET